MSGGEAGELLKLSEKFFKQFKKLKETPPPLIIKSYTKE